MKGLIHWLNRPYPYDDSVWKKIRVGVLMSIFVFLFLLIFQPFGLSGIPQNKLLILAGYGGITMLAYVIVAFLVPLPFPRIFREETWLVWKEFALEFVLVGMIAFGNFAYTAMLGFTTWGSGHLFLFIAYTFMVAVFPITLSVLATQIRMLKRYQSTSQAINEGLESQPQRTLEHSESQKLDLVNEDGKVELTVPWPELLFLAAADNYVEVYFQGNGKIEKQLIRSSLKRLEDGLPDTSFFRCHRSYVVNLHRVQHVSGNSAGLRLNLHGFEGTVPVSRSKTASFQRHLAALK